MITRQPMSMMPYSYSFQSPIWEIAEGKKGRVVNLFFLIPPQIRLRMRYSKKQALEIYNELGKLLGFKEKQISSEPASDSSDELSQSN